MIRIAIVEDEKQYAQVLHEYLERYGKENQTQFLISDFEDGLDIVSDYSTQYDIILLDIQMKHMNGMKAAELIRAVDENVIFIFITNTIHFALQGYTVDALGYVLKPVSYLAFSQLLTKASRLLSQKKEAHYLTFDIKEGILRMDISKIYYIESQRHYIMIHSEQKDFLTSGPMKHMEEQLIPLHFAKCHNAYLVNLQHVTSIKQNEAYLSNGQSLPISRTRKNDFMSSLADYIGGVHR